MRVLGLDIGGANIKGALASLTNSGAAIQGQFTIPLELFRAKDELASTLSAIMKKSHPEAVALTMTGELCDNFKNRREGVRWILDQTRKSLSGLPVKVLDSRGELISVSHARRQPMRVASANWAGLLRWAAENGLSNGAVMDIGSTTTDILPVTNGKSAARGRDDFTRAREGELVYTGYLRAHAGVVASNIMVMGREMRTCPEYFAIMGDAHLLAGDIKPAEYTCPAPDGGPKTKRAAARRLCRMALGDLEDLGVDEAMGIARQLIAIQSARLAGALERIKEREGWGRSARLILTGSGAAAYRAFLMSNAGMETLSSLGGLDSSAINPALCSALLWHGEKNTGEKPAPPPNWSVYLLLCSDGSYYCGATNDIIRRVEQHKRGTASRYTRSRLPVKLAAQSGPMTRGEALSLEAYVKRVGRDQKRTLVSSR